MRDLLSPLPPLRAGLRRSLLRGATLLTLLASIVPAQADPTVAYLAKRLWTGQSGAQFTAVDVSNLTVAVASVKKDSQAGGAYWMITDPKPRGHPLHTAGGDFVPARADFSGSILGSLVDPATGALEAAVIDKNHRLYKTNGVVPPSISSVALGAREDKNVFEGVYQPVDQGGHYRGFWWDRQKGFIDLGLLHADDTDLRPYAAPPVAGIMIGTAIGANASEAFAWIPSRGLESLAENLPNSNHTEARAVNGRQEAVVTDFEHKTGYVVDVNSLLASPLPALEQGVDLLTGINVFGDVVGMSSCEGGTSCPTVWRRGDAGWTAYDLRDVTTWRGHKLRSITYVAAINDGGRILAQDGDSLYVLVPLQQDDRRRVASPALQGECPLRTPESVLCR